MFLIIENIKILCLCKWNIIKISTDPKLKDFFGHWSVLKMFSLFKQKMVQSIYNVVRKYESYINKREVVCFSKKLGEQSWSIFLIWVWSSVCGYCFKLHRWGGNGWIDLQVLFPFPDMGKLWGLAYFHNEIKCMIFSAAWIWLSLF